MPTTSRCDGNDSADNPGPIPPTPSPGDGEESQAEALVREALVRSIAGLQRAANAVGLILMHVGQLDPSRPLQNGNVLAEPMKTLRHAMRDRDVIVPVGMEEVAIVCDDITEVGGRAMLKRIERMSDLSPSGAPVMVLTYDVEADPDAMVLACRMLASNTRIFTDAVQVMTSRDIAHLLSAPEPGRAASHPEMTDRSQTKNESARQGHGQQSPAISRFNSIVDYATDGIIILDASGSVRYANGVALSMFERDQSGLTGHSLGFPLTVNGATELELVDQQNPQRVRFVEVRSMETQWDGACATLMMIRDTSDRHAAELELISINAWLSRSMADIEAVATYVAHDLLQPIGSLHQCLTGLAKVAPNNVDVRGLLEIARQSLDALSDPVDGLLEYARSGLVPVRLEEVDCQRLVDDCRTTLSNEPGAISLGWLPRVISDRRLLRQVFQNLMANALRHGRSDRPPVVSVSAEPRETSLLFSVTDDGPGVPESLRERIFDPFWSASADSAGAGLGLAAAKRAVTRLGGRIWAEAPTEGGSQFFFTIPSAPAEENVVGSVRPVLS